MGIADIKKQLQFGCLMPQTQGIVKLNFASSQKSTIFALVNQQYGLPRESAFSLYSDSVNFENSPNNVWNKGR